MTLKLSGHGATSSLLDRSLRVMPEARPPSLHLFDGNAQRLCRVAEVWEVSQGRFAFLGGERLFHSFLVVEVELGEPVVGWLVSFGVRQRVVLDVPPEPRHLLRHRR